MKNLTLPIEKSRRNEPETIASILIIEDDVATATVLKAALSRKNFDVSCVYSGQEALDSLRIKPPHLVLLDAGLPDINGFAVCEQIRKLLSPEQLPIFMLTGLDDSESIEKAFLSGANDYIAKPYNIQVLCNRLTYMFLSKTESDEDDEHKSIMHALRLWNDFIIEVDNESKLIVEHGDLPKQLVLLLGDLPTMSSLLKKACQRQAKSHCNANYEPAFWLRQSNETEPVYFRCQLIKHASGQRFLTISDDTDNMNEAASLFIDADTGLPNQAKLTQQLQGLQGSQADTFCQNIATLHINNYVNMRAVMGEDIIIKHIKQFVSDVNTMATRLNSELQFFHIQKDTFVLIDNTLDKGAFHDFICEVMRPQLVSKELDRPDKIFTFSIGIANKKPGHNNVQTLINESSIAAHDANDNVNPIKYFQPDMQAKFAQRECMVTLLKRDIEQFAMELYFQPKFDAQTLKLTGMEALLRWHCDELGSVSPGEFLPIAESTNMMRSLSKLVINKALAQISHWIDSQSLSVPISINLDATNLSDSSLVDWFIKSVNDLAIPPHLVEVEVTESVMVTAESHALRNIKKLRSEGIRIAMDDFGTGYSSFGYLHSLPLDVLKIDMSFVREIERDSKIEAIAKAIISIGHEIGLNVVAEGVESQGQLRKLADMGCDVVQGFLTGKPTRAIECGAFFSGAKI